MQNKLIPIVAVIVVAVIAVFAFFYTKNDPIDGTGGVACTMEAKLCPDGTYVGRTGPLCEFTACPIQSGDHGTTTATTTVSKESGIQGTVLLGPTCPVERNPPDPKCADKPYAVALVLTTADGSKVLKQFSSKVDGTFSVAIEPGEYSIRSLPTASMLPRCSSDSFKVLSQSYLTVAVSCDTGIR